MVDFNVLLTEPVTVRLLAVVEFSWEETDKVWLKLQLLRYDMSCHDCTRREEDLSMHTDLRTNEVNDKMIPRSRWISNQNDQHSEVRYFHHDSLFITRFDSKFIPASREVAAKSWKDFKSEASSSSDID
jgi:hypothetical protein